MTQHTAREWQVFLLAVQFMTRLPVPRDVPYSPELQARAAQYYPLVGVLVGGIGAVVLLFAAWGLPWPVAVLLSMASTILATGALHEDGLADTTDGLGGGATRDKALEIMRDSRVGSYGVVAIVLVLALKATLLISLPVWHAAMALIVAHGASRMFAVHVVARDSYARGQGTKFAAPSISEAGHRFALASTLGLFALACLVIPVAAIGLAAGAALILGGVFRRKFLGKLGGYTGDCLGGVQQISELGVYLGLALWL